MLRLKRRKNQIETLDSLAGQSQFYLCLVSWTRNNNDNNNNNNNNNIVHNAGKKLKQIDRCSCCTTFQPFQQTVNCYVAIYVSPSRVGCTKILKTAMSWVLLSRSIVL